MGWIVQYIAYFLVVSIVGVGAMIRRYGKDGVVSYLTQNSFFLFRYLSYFGDVQRMFFKAKAPSYLPPVENVEKVSERVYRILGQNPGFHTLQGTNTYLVTGTSTTEHVLIDTGESITAKDYIKVLFDEVFPATKTTRLSMILLTHGHFDHQGGVKAILTELKNRKMIPLPLIYKRNIMYGKYPTKGFECINIEENQIFQVDKETSLQAITTPGHTDDHISFLLLEDRALFTGDCILGCGTTVFDDLYEYMNSLNKLKQLVKESSEDENTEIKAIYPGHGPVIRDNALHKIEEYIEHRLKHEKEIIQALTKIKRQVEDETKEHPSTLSEEKQYVSSLALVPLVYGKLPTGVVLSAQSNLLHHLKKLEKEGQVVQKFPDLWRLR